MTISELIERLEAIKAEHGDLEVHSYENLNESTEMVALRSDLDPEWGVQVSVGRS